MRNRIASAYRHPAVRLIAVALLAGTAAGCSSDVTRFDSFYSSTDNLTTGSVQHPSNAVNGNVPTPSADVAQGSYGNQPSDLSDPMSQPMPPAQANNGMYAQPSPMASNTRRVTDSPVQSAALDAPAPAAPSAQPYPAPKKRAPIVSQADIASTMPAAAPSAANGKKQPHIVMTKGPDPVNTGTVPAAADIKKPAGQKVAALEQKMPAHVPAPGTDPHQNTAILPAAPQAEKKKQSAAINKSGAPAGNTYTVASGDSLKAIAHKNGVTVDALKAANGLTSSAIRVGQELKIPAAGQSVAAAKSAAKQPTDNMKTGSVPAAAPAAAQASAPASDATAAADKPKAYQPPVADAKDSVAKTTGADVASNAPAETGIGKYRWPVTGAVIAGYGANVDGQRNDGVDISVPEGTPVKSAENGVVIYAGNGLEKLGNTVLVRHADGKVTVYAHLKSLDVNRGDKVTRGQVIADSGMTGNASRPKLHFEVRKDSAPINPMSFLE